MSTRNVISISLTPEEQAQIKQALDTLSALLKPHLMALTPAQRQALPKMGENRVTFVNKVVDYGASNPQFVPAFMDVPELRRDYEAVEQLTPFLRTIHQLESNLSDTVMMAGSEAYTASLQYYNSVKMAASMNIPGAKTIQDDLGKEFEVLRPAKEQSTDLP